MRLIDADVIRFIVADAQTQCGKQMMDIATTLGVVKEVLDEQPTVDAVEVVRCKECKYYRAGKHFDDVKFCFRLKDKWGFDVGYNFSDDDFCSYGERRTNDT